jgi:hypothetical protein
MANKKILMNRVWLEKINEYVVYVYWHNKECLYVGRSNYGIARAFQQTHRKANRAFLLATSFELHLCDSARETAELERALLLKHGCRLRSLR